MDMLWPNFMYIGLRDVNCENWNAPSAVATAVYQYNPKRHLLNEGATEGFYSILNGSIANKIDCVCISAVFFIRKHAIMKWH